MKFKKFDIILVHFPFSNLKESKIRPALVIKPLEGENTILCQITTKKRMLSKYEIVLPRTSCQGDVRFDSQIYLDMIFTLHESLVVTTLGSIQDKNIKQDVTLKLQQMFN